MTVEHNSSVHVLLWPPYAACDPSQPRVDLLSYMFDPKKTVEQQYQGCEITADRIFLERYTDLERETQDLVRRELQECFAEQGCARSISVKEWAKQTTERQTPRLRLRCTKVCGFGFQVNFDMERRQYYLVRSRGKSGNFLHKCPAPVSEQQVVVPQPAPQPAAAPPQVVHESGTVTPPMRNGMAIDMGSAAGIAAPPTAPASVPTFIASTNTTPAPHSEPIILPKPEDFALSTEMHSTAQATTTTTPLEPAQVAELDAFPLLIPQASPQQEFQQNIQVQTIHRPYHEQHQQHQVYHEQHQQHHHQQHQPYHEQQQQYHEQQHQQQDYPHQINVPHHVIEAPVAEAPPPAVFSSATPAPPPATTTSQVYFHPGQLMRDSLVESGTEFHDMDVSSVDSTDMMIARHFGTDSGKQGSSALSALSDNSGMPRNERMMSSTASTSASRMQTNNEAEYPTVNSIRSFLSMMTGSINSTMGKAWFGRNGSSSTSQFDENLVTSSSQSFYTSNQRTSSREKAMAAAAAAGEDPMDTVNSALSALSVSGMHTLGTTQEEDGSTNSGNEGNPFSADFWSPPPAN